ncbi:MAG: thiol oxidoreductase [Terriglobia bacterium]|nr:MAG: thiol oxidoreductase [Terriglobia bacterium]
MHRWRFFGIVLLSVTACWGQTDPGPRPGAAGAGGYFGALNASEQSLFTAGRGAFAEVDSVSGTVPGEPGKGLGPTFNGNSCAMCHAQPAAGGSSPGKKSPQNPIPNPQVALATLDGAHNTIPSFITADGPVREARFISVSSPTSALDGGVHGIYTIAGRTDAPGCNLAQPDFVTQMNNRNVIFRVPTPTFGLGLVENTPDATLQANLAATQSQRAALGIGGRLNTTGNDGTVTRFGWKAQNKSLVIFSGEAYNVEQGVTNEAFPNERSGVNGCVFNTTPEDSTDLSDSFSDLIGFAAFMRLSAPPTPTTATSSELNGQSLFGSIGCNLCHSPSLTTGSSSYTGMSNYIYHPYSDFALHHMGSGLADGINQGAAGPDEFRTAPLWGLGQRLFFLHDGRTPDLNQAILTHADTTGNCAATTSAELFVANNLLFSPLALTSFCNSEANAVISKYKALSTSQKQDILNFLRSL